VHFEATNRIRTDVKISNVIAELPGKDTAAGVVLVGAHLDPWQPGTGAQDNGTGVASVIETARAMKGLGRPPRRTVRFALFGGEEEGLLGSAAYVRRHAADLDKIDAVLITDSGSEAAKGCASHLSPAEVRSVAEKSDNLPALDYFKKIGALP
jgi:carboxypeptidase Q